MGFLFPKAPKPVPPANPAQTASTVNPFSTSFSSGGSFIGGPAGPTAQRKSGLQKTSLIGGG